MTVTPEQGRWEALAAARTRGDVGEGIASVLALLGVPAKEITPGTWRSRVSSCPRPGSTASA